MMGADLEGTSMVSPDEMVAALVELHLGLERQGPGDTTFTREILEQLPPLPAEPHIADLGCGSGASTLLLAQHFQLDDRTPIRAVDLAIPFLMELKDRAAAAGIESGILPLAEDMGELSWPAEELDLLWSEGAAYNLGFATALARWRPLLAPHGLAVISELSWFTEDPPKAALEFWQQAYPEIGTETENCQRAEEAGFGILFTQRLPSQAWWKNYYDPLASRLSPPNASPALSQVITETKTEIALFEKYSDYYGYTFYVLTPN